jgi:hypothetical protein
VKKRAQEGQPQSKPRLVKADRRQQVESFVLQDYEIEKADAEEAAKLGGDGVKVESVSE